jgi:transposase
MDEVDDADLVVERVAALDLGKAGLEACVRVPHPQRPGRRMQELRGYGASTAQLLAALRSMRVIWIAEWCTAFHHCDILAAVGWDGGQCAR